MRVNRQVHWLLAGMLSLAVGCTGSDGSDEPGADEGDSNADGGDDGSGDSAAGDSGGSSDDGGVEATVFWHEDIAPIVVGRCSGCHRDGGIAPYSFESYQATKPLAEAIVVAVDEGTMPPWGADETDECSPKLPFKHDLRLSEDEKQLLRDWAAGGAAEGNPDNAAPIPEAPNTELANPDQHLTMPAGLTIDGNLDQFWCFSLDPKLTEDTYLSAVQVTPGNDKVVHHLLIYVDETGETAAQGDAPFECSGGSIGGPLVGAWAPGALPTVMPKDAGMLVPAGARLVMNVHYHPTGLGAETDDSSGIDIKWYDGKPPLAARLALVGNSDGDQLLPGPNDDNGKEFRIPANVKDHTETMEFVVPEDLPPVRVFTVGTHMHYVGTDMILKIERATGSEECFLQTPHWNFEWQRGYEYDAEYDKLPLLSGGDKLWMRCTYDNTMDNPGVVEALDQKGVDAPIDVYLGEETLDEMCLGVFGVIYPNIEM